MDKWKELGGKLNNLAAKALAWFVIYVMVLFAFGLCVKTTQWVLSMMGVM